MIFDDIQKKGEPFRPAIGLDALIGYQTRRIVGSTLSLTARFLFVLAILLFAVSRFTPAEGFSAQFLARGEVILPELFGFFLIVFSFYIVHVALRAFYFAHYFKGLATILPEFGLSAKDHPQVTFELASLAIRADRNDLSKSFLCSAAGRIIAARLGISQAALDSFLAKRPVKVSADGFSVTEPTEESFADLSDFATALFRSDAGLVSFLALYEVTEKDFAGTARWTERLFQKSLLAGRFWGRDRLGRIPGIGKDWSFGAAYTLLRFAHNIRAFLGPSGFSGRTIENAVAQVEGTLARNREANVLLVGEESVEREKVIDQLAAKIENGSILPPLEYKHLFRFDSNSFIAATKTKAEFETQFLKLLTEAERAGNVILVLDDLSGFMKSGDTLGANVMGLLNPYLSSSNIQVLALSTLGAFHEKLEHDAKIGGRFEAVLLKELSEEETLEFIEDVATAIEAREKVFFTYQSIRAVADSADRYITEGVMPDKAIHLLSEIPNASPKGKRKLVTKEDVAEFVSKKTGIPSGAVGKDEREKLLNLESLLHERIIGQDEAVLAIAGAMRRARSGIESPDRPQGSFLFLGPTGVGKTETTKALAQVFFGRDDVVIRLDMSEYRTDDALARLIGSFELGKPGVLPTKLREQPYGVLLLDEFEKTNREVLDLFLQVLDEGFFADMTGRRVSVRSMMIIATSNAGSDLIWNIMKSGKNLGAEKGAIIDALVNQGIFKPELLNRFDGIILFHPLDKEHLRKIAILMLGKLQKRLAEKGIRFTITGALLDALVAAGTDPEFGARPMNRAIQEKVEQVIAKKMLSGEVKPGAAIELTAEELR